MFDLPIYAFKGKQFKTVSGLCKAIAKDCGATEVGCVGSDRTIKAYSDRTTVCAMYSVSAPVIGQPSTVVRLAIRA